MLKKIVLYGLIPVLGVILTINCAQAPPPEPKPKLEPEKKKTPPPIPTEFALKPFHRSMKEQMEESYSLADEIIMGVFKGSHHDQEQGLIYYFSDFQRFNQKTLSWGQTQKVVLQVRAEKVKPEIIRHHQFKNLIDLDKIGICWDFYQGTRYLYLVQGKKNLIFLQLEYDEIHKRSYRILLDTYPVTPKCRAKDVFNLMIRDVVLKEN